MNPSFELILALARQLYLRGALPEGLAIVREIFAAAIDDANLERLLNDWSGSIVPTIAEGVHRAEPRRADIEEVLGWVDPTADLSENVRALITTSTAFPLLGSSIARRVLRRWQQNKRPLPLPAVLWRRFLAAADLRSAPDILSWDVSSSVLGTATRQGLNVPIDLGEVISERAVERIPVRLSRDQTDLLQKYAGHLSQHGQFEPASRLALISAVTSDASPEMSTLVDIVRPRQKPAVDIARMLGAKGYPTEAVGILVDSLGARASESAVWQSLWDRVDAFGGHRFSDVPSSLPVTLRAPEPLTHEPPAEFFFQLAGPQARHNQVVRGTDVDLYFKYEPPTPEVLALITGKSLDDVKRDAAAGKDIELGVVVAPQGFDFRGEEHHPHQIARIQAGKLVDEVCFRLRAHNEHAAPGFTAVLTLRNAKLYEAFIAISLVDALDVPEVKTIEVLVSTAELDRSDFLTRDLTACFFRVNGKSTVSFRKGGDRPSPGKAFNDAGLFTELASAETWSIKAADNQVFQTMRPDTRGTSPDDVRQFQEATAMILTTGSQLFNFLRDDEGAAEMIATIESLPDGAKISIITDHAFIPWEILYPIDFAHDRYDWATLPLTFVPTRMWGYRFEIETILIAGQTDRLPEMTQQSGQLNMRIGVGAKVDKATPALVGEAPGGAFTAKTFHRGYCDSHSKFAHWLNNSDEVKAALVDPDYAASLIYLLCHGKNDEHGMTLDFTPYTPTPQSLDVGNKYPNQPVVFINSCSIGGIAHHAFTSYLRRFRQKAAYGLIASFFPLPTPFAAIFGGLFFEEYRRSTPLGEILLKLRRQLLDQGNPLAFFYSLQCPLDVRGPKE